MTNYTKGRKKEYKICRRLREEGYDLVQRSAGSHSPVDIFCFKKNKTILLVQAKPDSMSDKDKQKILDDNEWLNGLFEVRFVVE